MANMMVSDIVIGVFELQSNDYLHFQIDYIGICKLS